jgi:hypothetical protein
MMKIKDNTGEGAVEFDGNDMYVVRSGVRIAKRVDRKWVSLLPGVTVRDIKKKGTRARSGIEIIYSGGTH